MDGAQVYVPASLGFTVWMSKLDTISGPEVRCNVMVALFWLELSCLLRIWVDFINWSWFIIEIYEEKILIDKMGKKYKPVFDLDPLIFEYPFHQSNWPRGHPDTKTRNSEDQNYLLWHKIDLIESLLWHGVPHCLWWWQRNLKQRLFCGIQWTQNV